MKFCIIREVPYRIRETTRIVWGSVLCEREGVALLLIRKCRHDKPHSMVLAQQNPSDQIYEPVGQFCFDVETHQLTEIGKRLRLLGKALWETEFKALIDSDDFDPTKF